MSTGYGSISADKITPNTIFLPGHFILEKPYAHNELVIITPKILITVIIVVFKKYTPNGSEVSALSKLSIITSGGRI